MNASVIFLLLAILAVGIIIFIAILMTQRRGHVFDTAMYQSRLLAIKCSLSKTDPGACSLALVEADKLLDQAMVEAGIPGNTLGERLKYSKNRFTHIDHIWHSHKLRNRIVHEQGFRVNYETTKRALKNYEQALKDLGAI